MEIQRDLNLLRNNMNYSLDRITETISRMKKDNEQVEWLKMRIQELTSDVDVSNCPHRVFNGEFTACRYYEDCACEDPDFINCMFRENIRLKEQVESQRKTIEFLTHGNFNRRLNKLEKIQSVAKELVRLTRDLSDFKGL